MKAFEKLILLAGVVGLGVLFWMVDARAVARLVGQVGWGMTLIVGQEAVAHLLNAAGWRFAFTADQAAGFSFLELVRLRVTGDAINYLTPSATIAGEVTRAMMLSGAQGTVRAGGVLVAKCAQTLGQILFAVLGLAFVAGGLSLVARSTQRLVDALAVALIAALVLVIPYRLIARRLAPPTASVALPPTRLGTLRSWLRDFFRAHPDRFAVSTLLFLLGYGWGAFEAFWICAFLGVPVSVRTAFTIEVMSVALDGLFFMVSAKIGTQEGGKTAIFIALGFPAILGFAFGIVRHIRELTWGAFGLLLYWAHRRRDGSEGFR